ncbi:cuticle protein 10.9-like [Argiope bruennichi]|nr:cuticle protein 10.9-like [Argiope bruennichi]
MFSIICLLSLVVAMVQSVPVPQNQQLQDKERRIPSIQSLSRAGSDRFEQDVAYTSKPYQFGYELEDGFGMSQYRSEASDGTGVVKGSYGYMDPTGIYRKVEYTADSNGYRAVIRSNEPGTANQNVADALFIVEPPPPEVMQQDIIHNDISPRNGKAK